MSLSATPHYIISQVWPAKTNRIGILQATRRAPHGPGRSPGASPIARRIAARVRPKRGAVTEQSAGHAAARGKTVQLEGGVRGVAPGGELAGFMRVAHLGREPL
jgi:hypothetical protein